MKRSVRKILFAAAGLILILVLAAAVLLIVLSVREYRPKERENVKIDKNTGKKISPGQEISVLTWNTGYGALSETEDFFMDGGEKVRPDNEELITENIEAMKKVIKDSGSQVVFLQEVDQNSKRSYYINEVDAFSDGWLRQIRRNMPDTPLLVTAGGLFHYFQEEKVLGLLQMLKGFGNIELVFDTVNKSGMKMLQKKLKEFHNKPKLLHPI